MSENNLVRLAKLVLRGPRVLEDCRVSQVKSVQLLANRLIAKRNACLHQFKLRAHVCAAILCSRFNASL
jgi:hypothetical protein